MGDILRFLNEEKRDLKDCLILPKALADMIILIEEGTISGKMAKEIIEEMYKTGAAPKEIIAVKGLVQITDENALLKAVEDVLAANPTQLEAYRGGKDKLFGYFVGQVMKATKGKANPTIVNDLLKAMLEKPS